MCSTPTPGTDTLRAPAGLVLEDFYHAVNRHLGGTLGQRIEIDQVTVIDTSVIIATNRSLTGTDGEGFASADEAASGSTFPAKLAADLFESDGTLTRVYVDQNVVVCTRSGPWDDDSLSTLTGVVESFFLFYPAAESDA